MAEPERADGDPTARTENGDTMHTQHLGHAGHPGTPDLDPHTDVITTDEPAAPARRRGPDPLALVVGLATLAMAVFAFVGQLPDLSFVDPRWLLAGGAAAVGLVLLVGSLRGRSGGRRGGS